MSDEANFPNCRYHPDKMMRLVSSALPFGWLNREEEWRKENKEAYDAAPKIWRCTFPGCAFVEKYNKDEIIPSQKDIIIKVKPVSPVKVEKEELQEVEVGERVAYFSAQNSEEMAKAQSGLSAWLTRKIKEVRKELSEVRQSLKVAKERKWSSAPFQRQKNRIEGQSKYYCKLLAAVNAGYVLVPEFPVDIFAVRVNRSRPGYENTLSSDKLEVAEGRYVAGDATKRWAGGGENRQLVNDDFQNVTFPLVAAKPHVMQATAEAMEKKIFDEVGIVTGTSSYGHKRTAATNTFGDPLIIGIIKADKRGYQEKRCHFLIAWHVNVEDL